MKITLTIEDANRLYNFANAFIDNKSWRDVLKFIDCKFDNNCLTATMLNKYSGSILKLYPMIYEANDCLIAPPQIKFNKKDIAVTVEDTETATTYKTARGEYIYYKPNINGDKMLDISPQFKKPIESVFVNPKLAAKILSAFDGDCIKLDITGNTTGVIISGRLGTSK